MKIAPFLKRNGVFSIRQFGWNKLNYPRLEGEGFLNILSTEVGLCFDDHSCFDKKKSMLMVGLIGK